MAVVRPAVLSLLVAALAATAPVRGQGESGDAARLAQALHLRPGSVVAEIGAGDGTLTIALAREVGADGRVYTTELGGERVQRLERAVSDSGLSQIAVIEAQERHTNLADGCCDAILMRDVYHHFDDPAPMNASLLAALRPGGRLAIIDFAPSGQEAEAASDRDGSGHHGVGRQAVSRELEAAGFMGVAASSIGGRRYLVIAQKPPSGS